MILGLGNDIIEVERIKKAIARHGTVFITRIFTPSEIAYCTQYAHAERHFAGRFAAKEAIFKAMGDPKLNWKDVQILNDAEGKPSCSILNGKGKKLTVLISISHVKNYAVANAIVTQET